MNMFLCETAEEDTVEARVKPLQVDTTNMTDARLGLALAGLRSSAPHEALVDGPQILLPVIHFEATQVRTAGRCNHQLRIHGLALRLGPRHHRG